MEIQLNKPTEGKTMVAPISQMRKEKAFINSNGDKIDPDTKEILERVDADVYIPTQEEREALEKKQLINPEQKGLDIDDSVKVGNTLPSIGALTTSGSPLTIQEEIEQAEAHLAELQEKKKAKIAEMKAQLEMLEK